MQYSKPELEELGSIFQLTNVASGSGMGSVPEKKIVIPVEELEVTDDELNEMLEFGTGSDL